MKKVFKTFWAAGVAVSAALLWFVWIGGSPASADDENAAKRTDEMDPWATYRLLSGKWDGKIGGPLGEGSGTRDYEFIYNEQFLMGRHVSVRLPQERSPKGDNHHELSVFSFDSERKTIVLRQFIIEGYVLQFACAPKPMGFVCVTEQVENGRGMRARMTLEFENPYSFSEIFELANPGQELKVFVTSTWTRAPHLDD